MTEMTRIQQNSIRKNHFKPFWAVLLVVAILCITPIMAEELTTFDNVKQYDKSTQTVTIVNTFNFGRDISTIQLKTPLDYHVGAGYQKVAEFEIDLFDDTYTDAFDKMKFYDLNKDEEKIVREFDYKYLTTELVDVNDYDYVCDSLNKTGCENVLIGIHQEEREVWLDFNTKTLVKGKVTIGIFTNVQVGDIVEWIPTLFGKEIDEWATWTADLNVGLYHYYNFNEPSGTILIDSIGTMNGTNTDATVNVAGILGTAYDFEADETDWVEIEATEYPNTGSVSLWVKPETLIDNSAFLTVLADTTGTGDRLDFKGIGTAGNISITAATSSQDGISETPVITAGNWHHIVYTSDGAVTKLYVDSVEIDILGTYPNGYWFADLVAPDNYIFGMLKRGVDRIFKYDGLIDEAGFWNRSLTSDEVTQLYNGGTGITYTTDFGTAPIVTLGIPANTTNFTSSSIVFGGVVTDGVNLINVSLIINDTYIETNTSGINNSNYTFTQVLADGDYTWNYEGCDNESQCTNGTARSFSIDTNYPTLIVLYPNETITFHQLNTNLQLNWSANDTHIDFCWYNWNGTNVTVTCSDNTTNILINDGTNKNLTFYVNDTFGQVNSSFVSWNYRLFKNSETYDSEIFEGLSSVFSINLLTNGSDITAANLSYNNTNYLGTLSDHGSNNFTLTKTIIAPTVEANINKTFYWNITQGSLNYNLTGKNQTIVNLVIDNCSANTIVLYNFTIRNEENLTNLSSATTTARINLQMYGFATTTSIQEYTNIYNNINPFAVCLNSSLSTGGMFSGDVQVQYEATGYVTELYHIQNETITSSDFNQNISLYDLNETDSQIFKIIFRDSSFLPVENALIKIYRKYVDEGLYRIVEIPKTDKRGETIAHLFLDEVIYKLEVVKYGTILETFTDVIAVCQTPLVASCEIDLNAFSESLTIPDFEDAEDFSFTLGYDNDTRIISSVFSIPSGTVQTISLNVTRIDSLGTAVCTDSLLSSSGTLSCVVPTSFGNSTIMAKLYKDGVIQAQGQIKLDQTPFGIYGVNLVFLALFVLITLIGAGMSDNPIYTTIFLLVGVALLFALNLVANNGFIGATATILFLVVAIVLVIIKGAGRN